MSKASITYRKTSPKPPRFKRGTRVAFVTHTGYTETGEFLRVFTPARGAGLHYEILTDKHGVAVLFANGLQGRTVTKQEA